MRFIVLILALAGLIRTHDGYAAGPRESENNAWYRQKMQQAASQNSIFQLPDRGTLFRAASELEAGAFVEVRTFLKKTRLHEILSKRIVDKGAIVMTVEAACKNYYNELTIKEPQHPRVALSEKEALIQAIIEASTVPADEA